MNLHENKKLFADAVTAASFPEDKGGLGIRDVFLEKDYWITRSLKLLSESRDAPLCVFKGGTSLTKAFGLGYRFSEDIDIAITHNPDRTDNQTKSLISRICKTMSSGLEEVAKPDTRKFSKFRKVYYQYPRIESPIELSTIKSGLIQIETVAFANPYPYHKVSIGSLLRDFLLQNGMESIVSQYGMESFELNMLDIRRTATEKLVSLVRQSLADNYLTELRTKIRHFYDLHYLWHDETCKAYLQSRDFKEDFARLLAEDQARFAEPAGWQEKRLSESPLLKSFPNIWMELEAIYDKELSGLAFRTIPDASEVFGSFVEILELLR